MKIANYVLSEQEGKETIYIYFNDPTGPPPPPDWTCIIGLSFLFAKTWIFNQLDRFNKIQLTGSSSFGGAR